MLGSYPSTLEEIDSLGFTKLRRSIGAIARLKGLSIAARMGNLKVLRRYKNHRAYAYTPGSVKLVEALEHFP